MMELNTEPLSLQKNIIWNSVGSLIFLFCQWLTTIFVVRLSTGFDAAGILALAMSVSNLFAPFAIYKMKTLQISDVKDEYSSQQYSAFRLVTIAIAFAGCLVYSLVTTTPINWLPIVLYLLFRALDVYIDVFYAIEQRHMRMDYIGISLTARGVFSLLFFCGLLWLTKSLDWAIIGMIVATLPIAVFYDASHARRFESITPRISSKDVRSMLKRCLPAVLSGLMCSALLTIPRQYLSWSAGATALGIYASVATPAVIIQAGATYIYNPILGVLTSDFIEDRLASMRALLLKTLLGILGFSALCAIAFLFLGDWFLTWVFGAQIHDYVYLLQPVIACTALTALLWFFSDLLISFRNFWGAFYGNLIALLFTIPAMIFFINRWDMNGVSFAGIASCVVGLAYVSISLKRTIARRKRDINMEKANPSITDPIEAAKTSEDHYPADVLSRLQEAELDILSVIDGICRKNHLQYFLESGTLLGAVRHGGFIPWDDDIDIGMPIDDYRRLIEIAPDAFPEGYSLHTCENTPDFAAQFAKVYRDGTRFLTDETIAAGHVQGIFVDILPFSAVSEDEVAAQSQCRKAVRWQRVSYLYYTSHPNIPSSAHLRPVLVAGCWVAHYLVRLFLSPARIHRNFMRAFVSADGTFPDSDRWTSMSYANWGIFEKRWIFPTRPISFCGREFMGVAMPDAYLTCEYGDYMTLPPVDDRRTHAPRVIDFGDGVNALERPASEPEAETSSD